MRERLSGPLPGIAVSGIFAVAEPGDPTAIPLDDLKSAGGAKTGPKTTVSPDSLPRPLRHCATITLAREIPAAGRRTSGGYWVHVLDAPNVDGPVGLVLRRYRYAVDGDQNATAANGAAPPAASFRKMEAPAVLLLDAAAGGARMTARLCRYIERECCTSTFAAVARRTGVDEETVARLFYAFASQADPLQPRRLPRYLGIDEAHIHEKYFTVLVDLEAGKLFAIRKGIAADRVTAFLREFEGAGDVVVVAADLSRPFAKAIRDAFGPGRLCNDKRHVLELIRQALNEARNEALRNGSGPGPARSDYHMFNSRARQVEAKESWRRRMEELARSHPELVALHRAWEEVNRIFDRSPNPPTPEAAERRIRAWIQAWVTDARGGAYVADRLRGVAGTIRHRLPDILRYFDPTRQTPGGRRPTNAGTEAVNGNLKLAVWTARGFRSDENLRLRLLYLCGNRSYRESRRLILAQTARED